jgi:hypothetical protein
LTWWKKKRVKNAEKPAVFSAKKRENRVHLGGILNFFVSQIYLTSFGVLVKHDLDKSNPRDREATIPLTR